MKAFYFILLSVPFCATSLGACAKLFGLFHGIIGVFLGSTTICILQNPGNLQPTHGYIRL